MKNTYKIIGLLVAVTLLFILGYKSTHTPNPCSFGELNGVERKTAECAEYLFNYVGE